MPAQYEGERAVKQAFPRATIFRPAPMTGNEDKLFNNIAGMAKRQPFIPLIEGGENKYAQSNLPRFHELPSFPSFPSICVIMSCSRILTQSLGLQGAAGVCGRCGGCHVQQPHGAELCWRDVHPVRA